MISSPVRTLQHCLEALVEQATPREPDPGSKVIFLGPCTHFFHDKCIRDWHNSTRPERSTCPICRRKLFVANPLTAAQIRQLQGDTRLVGPHRAPGPDEVLIDREIFMMDLIAAMEVRREIERVRKSGGNHRWAEVAKAARDINMAVSGMLRPIFEPYRDTFVLVLHIMAVYVALMDMDDAEFAQNRGFAKFNWWAHEVRNTLPQETVLELGMDMFRNGIFVSDTYEVVTVPTTHLLPRQRARGRIEQLRADLMLQWSRSMRGRMQRGLICLAQCLKRRRGMGDEATR
jgi:hypothetical protein